MIHAGSLVLTGTLSYFCPSKVDLKGFTAYIKGLDFNHICKLFVRFGAGPLFRKIAQEAVDILQSPKEIDIQNEINRNLQKVNQIEHAVDHFLEQNKQKTKSILYENPDFTNLVFLVTTCKQKKLLQSLNNDQTKENLETQEKELKKMEFMFIKSIIQDNEKTQQIILKTINLFDFTELKVDKQKIETFGNKFISEQARPKESIFEKIGEMFTISSLFSKITSLFQQKAEKKIKDDLLDVGIIHNHVNYLEKIQNHMKAMQKVQDQTSQSLEIIQKEISQFEVHKIMVLPDKQKQFDSLEKKIMQKVTQKNHCEWSRNIIQKELKNELKKYTDPNSSFNQSYQQTLESFMGTNIKLIEKKIKLSVVLDLLEDQKRQFEEKFKDL